MRRLEQLGVLRGYHADVDLSALGMGLRAITELRLTPDTPYEQFEATLRSTPEVQLAFHVTGSLDYVLMLACPDVATLDRLLSTWRIEGGAVESSTRILLATSTSTAERPQLAGAVGWAWPTGHSELGTDVGVSDRRRCHGRSARTVSSRDCAASHSASSAPTFDSAASWAVASSRTFWWSS